MGLEMLWQSHCQDARGLRRVCLTEAFSFSTTVNLYA